jgi:hypothetical protein
MTGGQFERHVKGLLERKAAIARARHLEEIAGHEPRLWREVESLIATKQTARYGNAVELPANLRDLAERRGKLREFRNLQRQTRKSSMVIPAFRIRARRVPIESSLC